MENLIDLAAKQDEEHAKQVGRIWDKIGDAVLDLMDEEIEDQLIHRTAFDVLHSCACKSNYAEDSRKDFAMYVSMSFALDNYSKG